MLYTGPKDLNMPYIFYHEAGNIPNQLPAFILMSIDFFTFKSKCFTEVIWQVHILTFTQFVYLFQ